MAERRTLIEGLKPTSTIDPHLERSFVHGERPTKPPEPGATTTPAAATSAAAQTTSRAPISTRIRSDFAAALKRASLERQLAGTSPHTVQDILEEALEPWLRTNGYYT